MKFGVKIEGGICPLPLILKILFQLSQFCLLINHLLHAAVLTIIYLLASITKLYGPYLKISDTFLINKYLN